MEISTVLEQRFTGWLDQAPDHGLRRLSMDMGEPAGQEPSPRLTVDLGDPRHRLWWRDTLIDLGEPAWEPTESAPGRADPEAPPPCADPHPDEAPPGAGPHPPPTSAGPAQDAPGPGRVHPEPDLDPTIAELRDVGRDRSILDAAMLESVRAITAVTRDHVLDRHGWTGTELNRTQTRTLAADTKRATITEVQHALGFTVTEATTLVSLSMTASTVIALAVDALRRGEVTWAQVRRYWETAAAPSRDLSPEQRELVAQILFGTTDSLAAVERFDQDGTLQLGTPWAHTDFDAALEREVTACEGSDVTAERARRQRAHDSRKVRIRVHDDGTATLILRGPAIAVVGVHDRYDTIARNLKGNGHDNPLAHLLVDTMLAVLGFGHLDLPDPGTLADLSPTALDDLIAVVNGAPRITMQIIVPLDALTHPPNHPVHDSPPTDCTSCTGAGQDEPDSRAGGRHSRADEPPEQSEDEAEDTPNDGRPFDHAHGPPPHWATPDPGTVSKPGQVGYDPRLRHGRGLVAEVRGTYPFFITAGHARELFFTPGTTLHRLVSDTLDGRLVERTITTYRPDTDMRRQVKAADVYSRAPFSRLSGRSLEIDHVIPYGTGPDGVTGELNLADLDKRNHKIKTIGDLRLAINERRDLTFTTLLGQVASTRAHDYNQYLRSAHPDDLDEQRDLANRVLYALLAADPRYQRRPTTNAWLTIDHTDPDGQRRPGPPPHPEDAHTLLDITDDDQPEGD